MYFAVDQDGATRHIVLKAEWDGVERVEGHSTGT